MSSSYKQVNKPSKIKSSKNAQYKTEAETFKEPKSNTKTENRLDRQNRQDQLRKNKLNEFVMKKKGLLDSDILDKTLNGSKIQSQSISQSMTNLTALIDTRTYKNPPKIVALVALNEICNLEIIMEDFQRAILTNEENENLLDFTEKNSNEENENLKAQKNSKKFNKLSENLWSALVPQNLFKGKERITFFKTQRDIYCILDICKIADLVIFVSSTKGTDVSNWKKNPDKFSNCIDSFGYEILTMLRAQGLPQHIAVIQDLDTIADKHKSDVKKLFTRYMESELKPDKIYCNNNINNNKLDEAKGIIRLICSLPPFAVSLDIKKHRSYMLCQHINVIERSEENRLNNANEEICDLELFGYLRGNTINVNNFLHITGFGDYLISDVELFEDPIPVNNNYGNTNNNSFLANGNNFNNDLMDLEKEKKILASKASNLKEKEIDDKIEHDSNLNLNDLTNKPGLIGNVEILNNLQKKNEKNISEKINKELNALDELIDFDINIKDDGNDISFDEDEEENLENENKISNKHKDKTTLGYRTYDEMEFPDEVKN
jgi:hypothetical protein